MNSRIIARSALWIWIALFASTSVSAPSRAGGLTTIASFNGGNGADPTGGVTLDAQGNLYGTTTSGGAANDGTVWVLTAGVPEPSSLVLGFISVTVVGSCLILT